MKLGTAALIIILSVTSINYAAADRRHGHNYNRGHGHYKNNYRGHGHYSSSPRRYSIFQSINEPEIRNQILFQNG